MIKHKKVGIITWHYYFNFGSALQSFALFHTIKSLGYDPIIINYRDPKLSSLNYSFISRFKEFLRPIVATFSAQKFNDWHINTLHFARKYFKQSTPFNNEADGRRICKNLYAVVCGSDQIWAPNVYNPFYFAHFLNGKDLRKISYAASIGLNDIPSNLATIYRDHLNDFYKIAVREEEGRNLLIQKCGIYSTVVLDPTLLVNVSIYSKMQTKVDGIHRPYLFCYFLNKTHKYVELVQRYASEHNLDIVGVSDRESDSTWMKRLTNLGADHFLWLINNASAVMTDSYHGSIFSLLFHKDLWIFQRFEESDPICQNSRIRQLVNNFNLSQRLISREAQINDSKKIDYHFFESRLKELRESSIFYLQTSLS